MKDNDSLRRSEIIGKATSKWQKIKTADKGGIQLWEDSDDENTQLPATPTEFEPHVH